MRQITLDTETTGLKPSDGHRIIEIGCVELVNRRLTGEYRQYYMNPKRGIDAGAQAVHGISSDFLQDKPLFAEIVDDFLAFIDGAELIIHNAPFDLGFLNHELKLWQKRQAIKVDEQNSIIDTLRLAREMHPGQRNNLDALCKRYDIKHFDRSLHGAHLDAQILAHVYLAMTSGQASLFDEPGEQAAAQTHSQATQTTGQARQQSYDLPVIKADKEEMAAHETLMSSILTSND